MRNSNGVSGKYLPSPELKGQPPGLIWKILGRAALVLVSLLGLAGLISAFEASRMAMLPVTPLEPLAQTRDVLAEGGQAPPVRDGTRVRVEGFLRAEPPLAGRAQTYALQKLQVTHLEHRVLGGRTSRTRYTDAVEQETPRLWLYPDDVELPMERPRVEVRLPRLWDGEQLLISPILGQVTDAGTIPNNVFAELTFKNEKVQPQPGQDWELWSIRQNTRVTAVAKARLDTGRVLLDIERGVDCALSPDPWEKMRSAARRNALGQLALGLVCLLPLAWKGWKWIRRRRPASI